MQQVAPGTPAAVVDPIFGRSWKTSAKGLNGVGGFVQVDDTSTLGDFSEFSIVLPPVGSDGVNNRDRLYFHAKTPDPKNPGARIGYFPGDEWIEVYREGQEQPVAVGTPVSDQDDQSQLQILCRDVVQLHKKSGETQAGFWCNGPRDVFEYYTRAWQTAVSEDFGDSVAQFPGSGSGTLQTTADGRWQYRWVTNGAGGGLARLVGSGGGVAAQLASTATWADDGAGVDHGSWRAETRIPAASITMGGSFTLAVANASTGTIVAQLAIGAQAGTVTAQTRNAGAGSNTSWPVNVAGLLDAAGHLTPPYTLAIECRDRWVFFYLDGQLVSIGSRPTLTGGTTIFAQVYAGTLPAGDYLNVDYIIARHTTPPLNGGDPGDYRLASPPASGGLSGEYYDRTNNDFSIATPQDTPVAARTDPQIDFSGTGVSWMPAALAAASSVYVRWTGAIYLPLATQDVHFAVPTVVCRLAVGRTRDGEAVCVGIIWPHETAGTTSVGMRSLLGSKNGWYPIVFEYFATNPLVAGAAQFTYDVGGAGTVPPASVLSPYGIFSEQIPGGSHYDALRTIAERFVIQWKSDPKQLESEAFPGAVIPRVRVGRDTDYRLTNEMAVKPQSVMTAEDVAATLTAQAQGLGGNSSGQLTAEAFNFAIMQSHPFVSTEAENLPATSELSMLALHLETLLGLRQDVWQDVQTETGAPDRPMQDTFPLTGQLAEFDWGVGDGLFRDLPEIGIVDATPVQILQLKRLLLPDGVGQNAASFRPRLRDSYQTLRRFFKAVLADRRAFQGQLAFSPAGRANAPDFTEATLPADFKLVRKAELVILAKSDTTTAWTVEINHVATSITVLTTGIVDVSGYVARNNISEPRMIARLINPTPAGGGPTVSYVLRLTELIPNA